jgi:L-alanine-DL-glutamate epimerase-like enolase superfamily enzyme
MRAVSCGARALKLKAGGKDPDADVSAVAAVRRAVGARIGLRVDANGAWDARTACDVANRMSLIGVDWIEQPVPAGDIEGLVAVRKASPVRVAADEAIDGGGALERLLRAGAVDGVTLKPQMLGGLVATQRLARRALEAGLEVCITHAFESIIGRTGVLHLAASLEADGPHGLGHPFARDLAPVDPDLAGHLVVPTAPGLGVAPSQLAPRTIPAAQEAAS